MLEDLNPLVEQYDRIRQQLRDLESQKGKIICGMKADRCQRKGRLANLVDAASPGTRAEKGGHSVARAKRDSCLEALNVRVKQEITRLGDDQRSWGGSGQTTADCLQKVNPVQGMSALLIGSVNTSKYSPKDSSLKPRSADLKRRLLRVRQQSDAKFKRAEADYQREINHLNLYFSRQNSALDGQINEISGRIQACQQEIVGILKQSGDNGQYAIALASLKEKRAQREKLWEKHKSLTIQRDKINKRYFFFWEEIENSNFIARARITKTHTQVFGAIERNRDSLRYYPATAEASRTVLTDDTNTLGRR